MQDVSLKSTYVVIQLALNTSVSPRNKHPFLNLPQNLYNPFCPALEFFLLLISSVSHSYLSAFLFCFSPSLGVYWESRLLPRKEKETITALSTCWWHQGKKRRKNKHGI